MKHFSKKRNENKRVAIYPKKRIKKPIKTNGKNEKSKTSKESLKEKLEEITSDVDSPISDVEASADDDSSLQLESNDEDSGDEHVPAKKFDESDSESESDDENQHVPPDSLEVASDDSDFEESQQENTSGKVTIQMVNEWEKELNTNKRSMKPVSLIVQAFHGCLIRVSGDNVPGECRLRVDGSSVFNAVIRLSVTSIYPYLKKVMTLPSSSVTKAHVENSKRWPTAKNVVRSYLIDLIKLIGNVSSEDILRVLLKHLHQMIPFVACLPTISKPFLKRIISLWSTSEDDTVRVISFLCILRYAASDLSAYLHTVLKKMYFSYVVNCKFVSQNSLPAINFMRKSLTEMFGLNESITYNHAFMYIRQLAIHLKSAITLKKKDSIQAVYNWQFISSLRLWVDVLCNMQTKQQMSALIYPTVQVIIGSIKLIPTAQYLPLRFHCVQMLIKLSKETGIFIPVLPFLIEALNTLRVTQHKKLSMKPMDFTYILRLSKAQMQENAFKDAVIENVYDCLLEYTAHESYRMSFPDMVVVLQINLKQFLKDCRNANYVKKFKPFLEKIDEVSKLITSERPGVALSDEKGIAAWESNMKLKSNSLLKFYEAWVTIHEQKMARKATEKIEIFEHELPELKKLPPQKVGKKNKSDEKNVLFGSDSEDDDDDDDDDEIVEKLNKKCEEPADSKMEKISKRQKQKQKPKPKHTKRKLVDIDPEPCKKAKKSVTEKLAVDDGDDAGDVVENLDLSKFLS